MTQTAFGQVAPVSRRAIAYLIDAAIASGLYLLLGMIMMIVVWNSPLDAMTPILLVSSPIIMLVLLAWLVVYTIMQTKGGSIGMRAMKLRMASAADGTPIGFGRALLRNVVFGLAAGIVVGYFTPLFDGTGRFQGWHDKVADSLMLDSRVVPTVAPPVAPPPPEAPLLPAPSFERLPPAPMPGFAPAAPAARAQDAPSPAGPPAAQPVPPAAAPAQAAAPVRPAPPRSDDGGLIAYVPGVTQDMPPRPAPPAPVAPSAPVSAGSPVPPAVAPAVPLVPPVVPAPPAPPAPAAAAPAQPAPPAPPAPPVQPAPPAPAAAPVAPPAPAATPAAAPVPPALTTEEELEETRISIPGHRLVFTWDDGTRVAVSRRTIFGRNPAPEDGAVVVPVRDETLSLSKTHFEAAAETSGGWVLDRHSTNGTTIVRDGQRIACPPGQRVPVKLGDAIEIGDRIVTVGGYA